MVAEAGQRIALGALAQRAHQLGGTQARGPVGGELLEQLDVVGADDGRLGGGQDQGAEQLALDEESHGDHRLDPGGAQIGEVGGGGRRLGLADREARDPVLDPVRDRLEPGVAQDRRQRPGRARRPQAAVAAGGAREQRGAQRDEIQGGVQQSVGDRVGVLQRGEAGDVVQQALGGGLGGQAAELLDARAEGARARAQVLQV